MDPKRIIQIIDFAAKFEFYLFAATFLVCICILSVAASGFIVATLLDHTFPGWRHAVQGLIWLILVRLEHVDN